MNSAVKILIVDDNPNIHEIFDKLFLSHRDEVSNPLILHAENGLIGLEILCHNPDIDVIVLDLNMPVMDGFDTLAHIKGNPRLQAIPVCVFSGNVDDSTKALQMGASDFINKPGKYKEIKIRVLNLIKNKRQIEASERAKIDFLSTVCHELRTPMNGVNGGIQLMQMTEMTSEQTEYLEMSEKAAENMMTIVRNVLEYLQSDNPLHHLPMVPFSLRETIQECVDSIVAKSEANCMNLAVEIHPDLPDNLIGLPDKIQLIFQQLLGNAIKFSPTGTVVARINPGRREKKSVQLHCTISDTGIGIPEEKLSTIFEPFSQADGTSSRNFGGLGIGLSIASRIVQMMGGAIHVESGGPGAGSKFSFYLQCGIA